MIHNSENDFRKQTDRFLGQHGLLGLGLFFKNLLQVLRKEVVISINKVPCTLRNLRAEVCYVMFLRHSFRK